MLEKWKEMVSASRFGTWELELECYLFKEDYNRYELRDQETEHTMKVNIIIKRTHNRRFNCVYIRTE